MVDELASARHVAGSLIAALSGRVGSDDLAYMRLEIDHAEPEQAIRFAVNLATGKRIPLEGETLSETARWIESCRYFGTPGRRRLRDEMLAEIRELVRMSAAV